MDRGFRPYYDKINGQGCTGTTEQILEWGAKKWGFDQLGYPDLAKAMAVKESWWRMSLLGDYNASGYACSRSIMQIRGTQNSCGGWPDALYTASSTAFAADYAMAIVRYHYDGASWLGAGTRGSIRNAVGAYYCGCGSNGANAYTNEVFSVYQNKPWRQAGF